MVPEVNPHSVRVRVEYGLLGRSRFLHHDPVRQRIRRYAFDGDDPFVGFFAEQLVTLIEGDLRGVPVGPGDARVVSESPTR